MSQRPIVLINSNRMPERTATCDQHDSSRYCLVLPSKPPESINGVKVISCRVGHARTFCHSLASVAVWLTLNLAYNLLSAVFVVIHQI